MIRVGCVPDFPFILDLTAETGASFGASEVVLFNPKMRKVSNFRIPHTFDTRIHEGEVVVVLDDKAGTPLAEFEHPERALYLVGSNRPGEPMPEFPAGVRLEKVHVPTSVDYSLWSCVALGIVLHDRIIRSSL